MKGSLRHVVWLGKYCVLGLEACLSITSQKVVHMAGDRLSKTLRFTSGGMGWRSAKFEWIELMNQPGICLRGA